LSKAIRSAQQVSPQLALSTFAPPMISPDFVSSAAPTLNFEYGDTAPSPLLEPVYFC
jgi:hypothetical protein